MKGSIRIMGGQETSDENNYRCTIVVKPQELHFKNQRGPNVEIDERKENIRLKIWNDIEGHKNGMNGDKMITNGAEHQKRDEESNNTGLDKTETKTSEQKEGSSTQ